MLEQNLTPLERRNQLAEKILLTILGNATTNVRAFAESTDEGKASLAQRCLEMADVMIACQNKEKES